MKKFIFLFFIFILTGTGLCQDMVNTELGDINKISNKITLDIKGMDILDVLKILSMKSGLNIVAGKNVTGRVTIYLKEVDVWDALEIILVANNLAYERKGSIINVMTDRDYEMIYGDRFYDKKEVQIIKLKYAKSVEVSKALMQFKTNIGKIITDEASNTIVLVDIPSRVAQMTEMVNQIDLPIETKVFSLQYAKAEDVEKKITDMVTKNLGSIEVDARTNKIIVTDLPSQLENISRIIAAFDQKDAQVMIEAKILEVTLNNNFQMGIDWDFVANKYFKLAQTLKLNLTQGGSLKFGTIVGGGTSKEEGDYSGLIEALHEVGEVNTLSSPRIMALNNQESKILIGTKEPYSTKSTISNAVSNETAESVTFVDIGVKLYVTPTINQDGFITMKIKPEVSSKTDTYTTADNNTIPVISTTEAETSIMVKDGATVVIGGLIKDSLTKTSDKIPLLGSIPVVGKLFSNDTDNKKKEEIVVLLTPHIVAGDSTFTEAAKWARHEESLNKLKDRSEQETLGIRKPLGKNLNRKQLELMKEQDPVISKEQLDGSSRLEAQKNALKKASFSAVDYSNYFSGLKKGIQHQISKNFSDLKLQGEATVEFTLNSAGELQGEPKIIDESNRMIGDTVVEGVLLASPFESFPVSFQTDEENFKITVRFE